MTDDVITYYDRLLSEQGLDVALCWTVVEPLTQPLSMQTVAKRLGADPAHIRERPMTAAYDVPHDAQVIYLAQAGPAVALIEFNGYQGIHQIEQLSEQARVHSAFWNVNAVSELGCAAYGSLLVSFDGMVPDQRHGIDICALDEELDPLYAALHSLSEDDGPDFRSTLMAIIERRTGVRLTADWITDDQPAIVVSTARRDPPVESRSGFFDSELQAALWLAPSPAYQAFVRELAELLIHVGELTDEPEIRLAMEQLDQGVPVGDRRYEPLRHLSGRVGADFEDIPLTMPVRTSRTWRRMQASWALEHALMPPEHTPRPMHSLQATRLILGDDWLPARNQLRRHLRRTQ